MPLCEIVTQRPTYHFQDDDLRTLRDRREWIDALTEVKGGMSRDMKIELRSEARVS